MVLEFGSSGPSYTVAELVSQPPEHALGRAREVDGHAYGLGVWVIGSLVHGRLPARDALPARRPVEHCQLPAAVERRVADLNLEALAVLLRRVEGGDEQVVQQLTRLVRDARVRRRHGDAHLLLAPSDHERARP